MEKLTFKLEFITPAFIGGVNPYEVSELRPSSIVGVLRWWFRVIVGAYIRDTEELFKHESKLFGNQEGAGKVWIKVKNPVKEELKFCEVLEPCILKREGLEFKKDCGKSYLGFGNALYINFSKNKDYPQLKRLCLKKDILKGTFFVRPKITKSCSVIEIIAPKDLIEKVEALLFIFSQLGFLGSRGRRGWGNLYLKPKYSSDFRNWTAWDEEELKKAIKILIEDNINELPFEIYKVRREYSDGLEALEKLGRLYREFRLRYQPDYENVKGLLSAIKPKLHDIKSKAEELIKARVKKADIKNIDINLEDILEDIKDEDIKEKVEKIKRESVRRAFLGMPIIFRFRNLNELFAEVSTENGRMASPLIFRIVRLKSGNYSFIIIYLKNYIKPEKFTLTVQYKQNNNKTKLKVHLNSLRDEIVEEWINFLRGKGISIERVRYE